MRPSFVKKSFTGVAFIFAITLSASSVPAAFTALRYCVTAE